MGLLESIAALAEAAPAVEVCGLLTGTAEAIEGFIPAANVAPDPSNAFEVDPAALFAAVRAERAGGPRIVGHYHSHPGGGASPSARDAAMARGGELWLIRGAGGFGLYRAVKGGPVEGAFEAVPFAP